MSHGARPVHLIITMIKWIRTRRLSIKNHQPQVMPVEPAALTALLKTLCASPSSASAAAPAHAPATAHGAWGTSLES